jgi:hypothetical protein
MYLLFGLLVISLTANNAVKNTTTLVGGTIAKCEMLCILPAGKSRFSIAPRPRLC